MGFQSIVNGEAGIDPIDMLVARRRPGYALERPFYMDRAVFERDMERVFRRHWHCVGHVSQIPQPGDFIKVDLGDEAVIVVRDRSGAINAFLNVCRHRGAEVCTERQGNAKAFVCPYHAWTYKLDGSLRAARLMPRGFDVASHGLKRVNCRVAAGLLFLSFADAPLDFDPVAGVLEGTCGQYGWGEAKIAHRETYAIDANWKLAVENYVECYHCGPAHPEYSETHALQLPPDKIAEINAAMEQRTCALGVSVTSANLWQDSAGNQEAIHAFRYALFDGVSTGSQDGKPIAPLMGRFTDFDGGVTSIHVGGTTFLVCYPDHGMIYRFVPKDERSCEMELIWLVRDDAREGVDYDLARLTWLWKVTTDEDKKIIEHTSRGVRSHYYQPGPLAPMEYNELRYLDWYLAEIGRPAA